MIEIKGELQEVVVDGKRIPLQIPETPKLNFYNDTLRVRVWYGVAFEDKWEESGFESPWDIPYRKRKPFWETKTKRVDEGRVIVSIFLDATKLANYEYLKKTRKGFSIFW